MKTKCIACQANNKSHNDIKIGRLKFSNKSVLTNNISYQSFNCYKTAESITHNIKALKVSDFKS